MLGVLCVSGGAGAQALEIRPGEPSVAVGQSISLVEDDGRPLKACIAEITRQQIVLEYEGQRREIPTTSITRIQRGDSLRNGALVGFLFGAGFGLERLGSCQI